MLKHGYLEALARECGHDTTIPFDDFVEFENSFDRWHNHILVIEYCWYRNVQHPFCHVSPKCVYNDLNLFAKFAREWIIDTVNPNVADITSWDKIKEKVSVEFLGNNELTIYVIDDNVNKNLKVTFIDYNQTHPDAENGDKWELKEQLPS